MSEHTLRELDADGRTRLTTRGAMDSVKITAAVARLFVNANPRIAANAEGSITINKVSTEVAPQ